MILGPQVHPVAAVGLAKLPPGEPPLDPSLADQCSCAMFLADAEQGVGIAQAALTADGIAPAIPSEYIRIGNPLHHRRCRVDLKKPLVRPVRMRVDEPCDVGERGTRAGAAVVPPAQDRSTERVARSLGEAMGSAPVVARPRPEGVGIKRDVGPRHGRRHGRRSFRTRRRVEDGRRDRHRQDKEHSPAPPHSLQCTAEVGEPLTRPCSQHAANLFSPKPQCTTVGACHVPGISDGPDHAVPQWRSG